MSRLVRFDRPEFFHERWDPQPGEQVFISEPTQGGKTFFGFQLLDATPHMRPPVVLVLKPRDPTPAELTRRYGYKELATWPPRRRPWESQPPGYTLWPRHTLSRDPASIAASNANLKRQAEALMMDLYSRGDMIVFVDEIMAVIHELEMLEIVLALSNRGSGMNAAMWYATQKASGTVGQVFPSPLATNPSKKFFGYDEVSANRVTAAKMTGIDTRLAVDELAGLQLAPVQTPRKVAYVSELLHVDKNGPGGGYACIVGAP